MSWGELRSATGTINAQTWNKNTRVLHSTRQSRHKPDAQDYLAFANSHIKTT